MRRGVRTDLLQAGHSASGSVYLWLFRRIEPLAESILFTITVTPSSATAPIEIVCIEVLNDGGVDAISSLNTSSGTSETSSVLTSVYNDLVLFFGADNAGTFSHWGSGQTGISSYPTPPTNVTAWGSYQTQASAGTASSSRAITASKSWSAVSIGIAPAVLPWTQVAGKPFATVSPIGKNSGLTNIPNAGADYGPDSNGGATTTNGIQEALNSISGGGTVFMNAGTYQLSSPIYNTGSDQTVIFAAGCTLNFSNASATPYLNFNNDLGDIWVGCNFASASGNQACYHDCRWYGNGVVVNCSGFNYTGVNQTIVGNDGEIVIAIQAYIQTYSVYPSYNIEVDGFAMNGFGGVAVQLSNNAFAAGSGGPLSNQWRNVKISRINAVMAQNGYNQPPPKSFGTGVFFGGCNLVEVADCIIDCSNVVSGTGPDVSNCFVSSQRGGDTQNIVFRRCRFNSGGGAGATIPGSVLEAEGADTPSGGRGEHPRHCVGGLRL